MPDTVKKINKITTSSIEQTIKTGEQLGAKLSRGDIVLLKGELGAGKTHFVKGIARFFHVPDDEVQSPTFSLIHEYPGKMPLYHVDAYRIRKPEEALEFGLEEYLYGDGICVIEWPENIANLLPQKCWVVELSHINQQKRRISIYQQD